MFILLTDALTGKEIIIKKSLIAVVYSDKLPSTEEEKIVSRIDFLENRPSEFVEESVYFIYNKLIN